MKFVVALSTAVWLNCQVPWGMRVNPNSTGNALTLEEGLGVVPEPEGVEGVVKTLPLVARMAPWGLLLSSHSLLHHPAYCTSRHFHRLGLPFSRPTLRPYPRDWGAFPGREENRRHSEAGMSWR